jgi:hypothetical protein
MSASPKNNALGEVFVEARDSAVAELQRYLSGWSPKNPNSREREVASFLHDLPADERVRIEAVISHFTEAALFKLLSTLESGEGGHRFRHSAICDEDNSEQTLIDEETDNSLVHAFFTWMGQGLGAAAPMRVVKVSALV